MAPRLFYRASKSPRASYCANWSVESAVLDHCGEVIGVFVEPGAGPCEFQMQKGQITTFWLMPKYERYFFTINGILNWNRETVMHLLRICGERSF